MLASVRLAREGKNWLEMTFAAFYAALSALDELPPQMVVKATSDYLAEKNMDNMERELVAQEKAPDFRDPFEGV